MYRIDKSLYHTPETNRTPYDDNTSIINKDIFYTLSCHNLHTCMISYFEKYFKKLYVLV